jgi:hypothetical protein
MPSARQTAKKHHVEPPPSAIVPVTAAEARKSQLARAYEALDEFATQRPVTNSLEAALRMKTLGCHRPFKALAAKMEIPAMVLYWAWVYHRQGENRADLTPLTLAPPERGNSHLSLPRARQVNAAELENWVQDRETSQALTEELDRRKEARILRALETFAPPRAQTGKKKKRKEQQALRYSLRSRHQAWNLVKTTYPGPGGWDVFNTHLGRMAERGEVPLPFAPHPQLMPHPRRFPAMNPWTLLSLRHEHSQPCHHSQRERYLKSPSRV